MFAKAILLLAVLVAGSTPALAQLPLPLPFPPFPLPQGTPEERAACAPDVHRFCRTPCRTRSGCCNACRPIGAGSAEPAARSWNGTGNDRHQRGNSKAASSGRRNDTILSLVDGTVV